MSTESIRGASGNIRRLVPRRRLGDNVTSTFLNQSQPNLAGSRTHYHDHNCSGNCNHNQLGLGGHTVHSHTHDCSENCNHSHSHDHTIDPKTNIFRFVQSIIATNEPVDFNTAIKNVTTTNRLRLSIAPNGTPLHNRLKQRLSDLKNINTFFTSNTDLTFFGFIGWGPNCIGSKTFKSSQKISAVNGFVYKDKDGHFHYQDIGSSIARYKNTPEINEVSQLELGSSIATFNGLDFNLGQQEVRHISQDDNTIIIEKISEHWHDWQSYLKIHEDDTYKGLKRLWEFDHWWHSEIKRTAKASKPDNDNMKIIHKIMHSKKLPINYSTLHSDQFNFTKTENGENIIISKEIDTLVKYKKIIQKKFLSHHHEQ
ncbi:MAG: hypothetical protein ACON35_05620 [Candidatus Marinamargulisbacteria bacterium]